MKNKTVDHARDAIVATSHALILAGRAATAVSRHVPCPVLAGAGAAAEAAGEAGVGVADDICSRDRGIATRDC